MYAILGVTGKVGGVVAQTLLDAGQKVRAVLRDRAKAADWSSRGCAIAYADIADAAALTTALTGAEAVFILIPPNFDPQPGFPEIKVIIAALTKAITAARPQRIVCLSTIGAQASKPNLLGQLGEVERALGALDMPVCFLRAAWFMENALWDVPTAREGVIGSFLQPLDQAVPMVATADVGRIAAQLLQETWTGPRIVELEGPARTSPNDIAAAFANALGRPVRAEPIARDQWETLFTAQGMHNPVPRAQMLDGFNEGWIAFEDHNNVVRGQTDINMVIRGLCDA